MHSDMRLTMVLQHWPTFKKSLLASTLMTLKHLHKRPRRKKYQLNGVDKPFWHDWAMSDPACFLTPEPLRHWHKIFFDHDLKWATKIIGADELGFWFSILQPKVSHHHSKGGVSKLKQCTGQEHQEMQRHIIGLCADATDPEILLCFWMFNDFRYLGQGCVFNGKILQSMQEALSLFHSNKDHLLEAGAQPTKKEENWYIPKLEFMQSVVQSIFESGAPMQWSADPTEKAHSPSKNNYGTQ